MKESGGGMNSSVIYFIHCKDLCQCPNVPSTQHNNKGKKDVMLLASKTRWGHKPRYMEKEKKQIFLFRKWA
jgi:hypothetical protein